MKRILIVHTGGTFGMVPMEPSQTLAPGAVQDELLRHVPELGRIAHIETALPFNLDSSNMTLGHWRHLARLISQSAARFHGFVIIHGTDTLAYTASALSFMLRGLARPVVLTGSQRPLVRIRTDARSNLINAVEIAASDIAEVCVFFGTRLFRGNRTTKISAHRYDAFSSPNFPALAEVGVDVSFASHVRRVTDVSGDSSGSAEGSKEGFEPFLQLEPSVVVLTVFPGLPRSCLEGVLAAGVRAVVVLGYGPGNVPIGEESLLPFIRSATERGSLVALNTQCAEGRVSLESYECGRRAADEGAMSCMDMTLEASVTKLMYLLGRFPADGSAQGENPSLGRKAARARMAEVAGLFVTDLAGELSAPARTMEEAG